MEDNLLTGWANNELFISKRIPLIKGFHDPRTDTIAHKFFVTTLRTVEQHAMGKAAKQHIDKYLGFSGPGIGHCCIQEVVQPGWLHLDLEGNINPPRPR